MSETNMLPDVEVVELDNGFKALLVERGPLPVVASVLWYRVGARDERTAETGVSHFLEHMMFKGTDRFAKGQIDLQTSKMGGSNNAFTDNDSTAYYFSLAADRWETALEIEASRMRSCLLDPAEFASEKNVVLEELAMGEDDPWRPLYQATESMLFQVHPYHHPVIGYREDLERLSARQMRDYYARHYGPNRAFLVVVGAIDRARTAQRIRE
ncbi:MAG: insulinase family protein, partial [Planctomycetes bacterium]|nr:insulinase family protein [Planctomycetota bacterium]